MASDTPFCFPFTYYTCVSRGLGEEVKEAGFNLVMASGTSFSSLFYGNVSRGQEQEAEEAGFSVVRASGTPFASPLLERKDRRPGRPGISPVLATATPSPPCLIGVPEEEGQEAGEARDQPCVGLCCTLNLLSYRCA
jgi:hypothetical protein